MMSGQESDRIGTRMRVAVTTAILHRGLERLCPSGKLRWGNCDFLLNPPPRTLCDYWIVFAAGRDRDEMLCAPENTLFIAGEPPSKKIYPRGYYAQFDRVVSAHASDPHPRVTPSALGLNWHVGLSREDDCYHFGYDELAVLPLGVKVNKLSVVCSNLTTTEGQRNRLRFLDAIKGRLGERVIHHGRGFTPISDKMDAIYPYRFHLVFENCRSPDYWTEKLSDSYLGWAYPFYVGCPNLADYFPAAGFIPLDMEDPDESARVISERMDRPADEAEVALVGECRNRILNTYNPFARFAHWANCFYEPSASSGRVRITSHKAFRPFPRGLLYRLRSL
jgi:hypothetical protein